MFSRGRGRGRGGRRCDRGPSSSCDFDSWSDDDFSSDNDDNDDIFDALPEDLQGPFKDTVKQLRLAEKRDKNEADDDAVCLEQVKLLCTTLLDRELKDDDLFNVKRALGLQLDPDHEDQWEPNWYQSVLSLVIMNGMVSSLRHICETLKLEVSSDFLRDLKSVQFCALGVFFATSISFQNQSVEAVQFLAEHFSQTTWSEVKKGRPSAESRWPIVIGVLLGQLAIPITYCDLSFEDPIEVAMEQGNKDMVAFILSFCRVCDAAVGKSSSSEERKKVLKKQVKREQPNQEKMLVSLVAMAVENRPSNHDVDVEEKPEDEEQPEESENRHNTMFEVVVDAFSTPDTAFKMRSIVLGSGPSLLQSAVQSGSIDTVKALIKFGVKVPAYEGECHSITSTRKGQGSLEMELIRDCVDNGVGLRMLRYLIEDLAIQPPPTDEEATSGEDQERQSGRRGGGGGGGGRSRRRQQGEGRKSILMCACEFTLFDVVQYLCDSEKVPNEFRKELATERAACRIVRAPPAEELMADDFNTTPWCVFETHHSLIKVLLTLNVDMDMLRYLCEEQQLSALYFTFDSASSLHDVAASGSDPQMYSYIIEERILSCQDPCLKGCSRELAAQVVAELLVLNPYAMCLHEAVIEHNEDFVMYVCDYLIPEVLQRLLGPTTFLTLLGKMFGGQVLSESRDWMDLRHASHTPAQLGADEFIADNEDFVDDSSDEDATTSDRCAPSMEDSHPLAFLLHPDRCPLIGQYAAMGVNNDGHSLSAMLSKSLWEHNYAPSVLGRFIL